MNNYLKSISPIDGRYRQKTENICHYFSEMAIMKYRVKVEICFIIEITKFIPQLKNFPKDKIDYIKNIYINFDLNDALDIKKIEEITNHDVKAIEYFIKNKFDDKQLSKYKEFIHIGLTSQDINNTAFALSIKDFLSQKYLPLMDDLISYLNKISKEYTNIPILSHTHGQPASPTLFGKEIYVFVKRLSQQLNMLKSIPISTKFSGANGNMNALNVTFPQFDWIEFAEKFITEKLQLNFSYPSTQIDHYDNLAAIFDNLRRINNIILDLDRDMWLYISMDYLKQTINKNEVGSSTMPHKVNPIDFENSEGNIGIANSILSHLSDKLPISRLQRDLSDSTAIRNIGVAFAHSIISIKSTLKGLEKITPNLEKINYDLNNNWAVISEAIQTILKRENVSQPYQKLKELTRTNSKITKEIIHSFIDDLDIKIQVKEELKNITPFNYTGVFKKN